MLLLWLPPTLSQIFTTMALQTKYYYLPRYRRKLWLIWKKTRHSMCLAVHYKPAPPPQWPDFSEMGPAILVQQTMAATQSAPSWHKSFWHSQNTLAMTLVHRAPSLDLQALKKAMAGASVPIGSYKPMTKAAHHASTFIAPMYELWKLYQSTCFINTAASHNELSTHSCFAHCARPVAAQVALRLWGQLNLVDDYYCTAERTLLHALLDG